MKTEKRKPLAYALAAIPVVALAFVVLAFLAISMGGNSAAAESDDDDDEIAVSLVGTGAGAAASGELKIEKEELAIRVRNAPPGQRFNVFLTQTGAANRTPASNIGSFTTDSAGRAKFELEGFDVTKAFAVFPIDAPVSPVTGERQCGTVGASVTGPCNVVQLNSLRIYFADPTPGLTRSFDGDGQSGALLFNGVLFDTGD